MIATQPVFKKEWDRNSDTLVDWTLTLNKDNCKEYLNSIGRDCEFEDTLYGCYRNLLSN